MLELLHIDFISKRNVRYCFSLWCFELCLKIPQSCIAYCIVVDIISSFYAALCCKTLLTIAQLS